MATNKIREEEVKNKIRQEFFQDYDATPILGDIDFAVTTKKSSKDELSDQEYLFIAKDIAQVTDQKIEYSKHKGLDDKKCEALLLDSLKDHGSLTKPEIVRLLWDVLPDQLDDKQKEYKINNLLRKLRKEGKISNTTIAGNKSTWALVNG